MVSYAFAATSTDQTPATVTYALSTLTFSASLAHDEGYAGAALRLYAPGNADTSAATPLDASGFSRLRIHLASTTDGALAIKLQPSPVAADGCAPTARALIGPTTAEFVIDLDDASFALPSYCTASATTLRQMLKGLYAIDVINDATSAGPHDVVVGTISLVP